MQTSFTPDLIGSVVSTITQLLFSYFPGLNTRYAGLKKGIQNLVTTGLVLLTTVAIYLATIYNILVLETPLTVGDIIRVFFMTLIAKVAVGVVAPETEAVTVVTLQRDERERMALTQKLRAKGVRLS